ncbi:hypothetical protein HOLleu_01274 [Holothuria leucospilota]|uniref:Uncharacterized protein n=1 Tax=Holothuria leucospilota TaxID=206669 RepID=A0A9Q1CP36_HOLLE|nr:hypothetical protein HOLleu_01274 [Holothuria leucospilota]
MFCDEFSLDLAYFTTRSVHQNGVFVVDSISWSEGVITVKGGHDELVLNIEMDEDCGSRKWRRPLFESWYLHFPWSPYCDIYDIPTNHCDLAMEELRQFHRVDTWADVTIVSPSVYRSIPEIRRPVLRPTTLTREFADGSPFPFMGRGMFKVRLGDKTMEDEVWVQMLKEM